MKIEILLSTMNQTDFNLVDKCNIRTDAVIVNQCNHTGYEEKEFPFGTVRMYSNTERGLSKSRNLALKSSKGDICVLCDDDERYVDNYEEIICKAFNELKDADVIVFDINRINAENRDNYKKYTECKRIPKFKTYGSVQIAFKRKKIIEKGIMFNELFGTGSGKYSMAEDSLFFRKIHENNLKAYIYPEVIAEVVFEESSWFKGYNKKYFYDVGAFLMVAYPKYHNLLKWYYPLRFINKTDLNTKQIIRFINHGMRGYKNKQSFKEYFEYNKKKNRVFMLGDFNSNNGPANANRKIYSALKLYNDVSISLNQSKIGRIVESIYKIAKSDICILCSASKLNYLALKIVYLLRKKSMVILHGCGSYEFMLNGGKKEDKEYLDKCQYEEKIFEKVNKIICVSKMFSEDLKIWYPKYKNKISYINNVVENLKKDDELSNYCKNKNMIISIGGGRKQKQNIFVAQAIDYLNKEKGTEFEYIVIGPKDEYGDKIKQFEFVTYYDYLPNNEVISLMKKSFLYVQNSEYDTFGLAVLEAFNEKNNLLLSRFVGCKNLFNNISKTDIIEHPDDIIEIAEKIYYVSQHENYLRLKESFENEKISKEYIGNKLNQIIRGI